MAATRQLLRHSAESFVSKNFKEEWAKVSKTGVLDRLKLIRMGVLTLSFYILTNSVQRFAGMVSIHSGQNFLATRSFGLFSTTACCLLSREIQEHLLPVNKLKHLSDNLESPNKNAEDIMRRAYLGLGVFSLLEKKSFLTALPSSVIALGVHAQQSPLFQKGAVLSTSKVATPTQRQMIQILGNRHGCHQCGSRQFFSAKKGFIADHMPPTNFVERLNDVWWRKKFNIKVEQLLWPQCQKCFRVQGTAVKMNRHVLIHHHNLRMYHFAPAIAFYLSQNEDVQKWMKKVAKAVHSPFKKVSNV